MPLDKKFNYAEILEINPTAFKLTICYSYYSLYTFKTVFVYKTQEECLHRLCLERCSNKITITKQSGDLVSLNVGEG
jgi:hypothetical protein